MPASLHRSAGGVAPRSCLTGLRGVLHSRKIMSAVVGGKGSR
jgi:hypothetical protein